MDSLQGLKDDLSWDEDDRDGAVFRVARRVAELYKECPVCSGSGCQLGVILPTCPPKFPMCFTCMGSGVVASEIAEQLTVSSVWPMLARFLFGAN
jgi:hypothetical protein